MAVHWGETERSLRPGSETEAVLLELMLQYGTVLLALLIFESVK